jgi:hypothetical protein
MHTSAFRNFPLHRVATLSLLLMASADLYAQQTLSLSLSGAAEVPPVTTTATGTAQITVGPDHQVSGSVKTSGIDTTMAHIHEATTGPNGPPIITLTKTANDGFDVPADARLTDAQYASFLVGKLYVNVHSAAYPNGEIRAPLLPTPATPEKQAGKP